MEKTPSNVTLSEYADTIADYANRSQIETNEDFPYSNSSPEHASIVLSNMFRVTEKNLILFTGNLSNNVCNEFNYTKELDACLSRVECAEFLFEEIPTNSLSYDIIQKYIKQGKNIKVFHITDGSKNNISKVFKDGIRHFAISDFKRYRFESNPSTFEAVGNFCDKKTCSVLQHLFNILKQYSTQK